jgi:hypothetical protein
VEPIRFTLYSFSHVGYTLPHDMPRFQLEVSIAFAVSIICSIGIFYLSRTTYGKIQLPTDSDELDEFVDFGRDPFDVTKPEDIVDGYPIDEPKFWEQVWTSSFPSKLASNYLDSPEETGSYFLLRSHCRFGDCISWIQRR